MGNKPNYTWKTKNKLLITGSICFAFLVYQLAVKKTINVRNTYFLQQKGYETKQITLKEISELKKRITNLSTPTEGLQAQNFFETEFIVSLTYDTDVIVKNLSEAVVVAESSRHILYNAYYFSGPFIQLLKLLDHTEKNTSINVLNAQFYKEKNQVTRKTELIMKVETATID